MDKIIFEYGKIFSVEERTPLTSLDQVDILTVAGVSLATLVQRQNKEFGLQDAQVPATINKAQAGMLPPRGLGRKEANKTVNVNEDQRK